MNPGPVEEMGKVAVGVVDALKSAPMSIAMIITNVMLLVFLFYSQGQFFSQRQEVIKYLIENESEVQRLLSKCIVPDNPQK